MSDTNLPKGDDSTESLDNEQRLAQAEKLLGELEKIQLTVAKRINEVLLNNQSTLNTIASEAGKEKIAENVATAQSILDSNSSNIDHLNTIFESTEEGSAYAQFLKMKIEDFEEQIETAEKYIKDNVESTDGTTPTGSTDSLLYTQATKGRSTGYRRKF